MKKILFVIIISLFLSNTTFAYAYNNKCTNNTIKIDGCFDDWKRLPHTYHYNWNNSQNCWKWGEYADINNDGKYEKYMSPCGKYNNDVRHLIQLHSDGEYVYVRIKIATIYLTKFNGENYQFYFNCNNKAVFQITDQCGKVITNNIKHWKPGTYAVQVRHAAGRCSYQIVEGASAYLKIYCNHLNSEIEFKIPLSACKQQNCKINLKNLECISFFTPNLMYCKISCHGTSTGPIILIVILSIFISFSFIKRKRKKVKS